MSLDLLSPMVFDDLAPIQVPITWRGKEYKLCECDVPGVAKFKSVAAANFKYANGEMAGLSNIGDMDPLLVTLCLKRVLEDGTLSPVDRAFVDKLPSKMVRDLADRARDINPALDEKPTKESLDKQISRLTAMREKLFGVVHAEDNGKN